MNDIPIDHIERMKLVINHSWTIFKKQFVHQRHIITKEAPFQHHFANIINSLGQLYCLSREDRFIVDLEAKTLNIKGKTKNIDITCEFVEKARCALELKFKTKTQGAEDWGRIDAYVDIEALELVTIENYDFGVFFMITNNKTYINKSKMGTGVDFAIHEGHSSQIDLPLSPKSKGREHVVISLKNSYSFNWDKVDDWYFLQLYVDKVNGA